MARVVGGPGVAAPVSQAEIVESVGPAGISRNDPLQPKAEVMPRRKVEADRSAAAAAGIAVALAKGEQSLLLLMAAEAPGVQIFRDQPLHRRGIRRNRLAPG